MNMNIGCPESTVHLHMINHTWKRPAASNANSNSKGRCSMLDTFVQENHPLSSNIEEIVIKKCVKLETWRKILNVSISRSVLIPPTF